MKLSISNQLVSFLGSPMTCQSSEGECNEQHWPDVDQSVRVCGDCKVIHLKLLVHIRVYQIYIKRQSDSNNFLTFWYTLVHIKVPLSKIISSDRSSYSDDVLLHIHPGHFFGFSLSPLMQLMLQMSI